MKYPVSLKCIWRLLAISENDFQGSDACVEKYIAFKMIDSCIMSTEHWKLIYVKLFNSIHRLSLLRRTKPRNLLPSLPLRLPRTRPLTRIHPRRRGRRRINLKGRKVSPCHQHQPQNWRGRRRKVKMNLI